MANPRSLFKFFRVVILSGTLTGTLSAETTITVDVSQSAHTVSPLLFGDQIQWPGFGQDLLVVDSLTPTTGSLRTSLLDAFKPLKFGILRYPGGTLSDMFHWSVSTGPYSVRLPQKTMDLQNGSTYQYQTQVPYFGADEFVQAAQYLGTEMMITANVATGTAQEAAAWLSYYKSQGVTPRYWEIGNEVYLPGDTFIGVPLLDDLHLDATTYATRFDAFASALRAVDPSVQIGVLGVNLPAPGLSDWNQKVLTTISQKADFMAVHNAYNPEDSTTGESLDKYRGVLAASKRVEANLQLIKQDIQTYAPVASRGMPIAITEHASIWSWTAVGSTLEERLTNLYRNHSLGSALYSALMFHVFLREQQVQIANHINPVSPYFQAPYTVQLPNLPGFPGYSASRPTYPTDYDPSPVTSAYGFVQRLYAESGGGSYIPATVSGSPTYDSPAIGSVPAYTAVPVLDAVAVRSRTGASRLYVYVVNRDVSQDVAAQVNVPNLTTFITGLTAQELDAADVTSKNSIASPHSVTLQTRTLTPADRFSYTFPAHSLTRFTFALDDSGNASSVTDLSHLNIFPNPMRPARGHRGITFSGMPSGTSVEIFSLAGEKIQAFRVNPSGGAFWDGTSLSGERVASGVYLARIEAPGEKKTVKLAIQR